jgi:hypothetical protein
MAIQFTDFSDPNKWAQNKQEGIANFLPNYLKGYQTAKEPQRMEDERQKLLLENLLSGHKIQHAGLENQYYGQSKESDMALQDAQRKNQLAQALKNNYEAQNLKGEPGDNTTNSVPLGQMTAGERQYAAKSRDESKKKAHAMIRGAEILDRMEKLIKDHPNMSEDFFASISDPSKPPGFFKAANQKFNPFKGDIKVAQKFNKEAAELVLQMIDSYGKERATDMRTALVQASKPQGANTDEANLYLISNLRKQFKGGKQYLQDLNQAEKSRRHLLSSPEDYSMKENDQEAQLTQQMQQAIKGAEAKQPPSMADIEHTAKKHGITVEEVKRRLGIE